MKSFLRSVSKIAFSLNIIFVLWMAGCGTEVGNPDTNRSEEKAQGPSTKAGSSPDKGEGSNSDGPVQNEVGPTLPGDPANQNSPVTVTPTPTPSVDPTSELTETP